MRFLALLIIFGPLIAVALADDWVAIGTVASLYFVLGAYGMARLDNGERAWREYWDLDDTGDKWPANKGEVWSFDET